MYNYTEEYNYILNTPLKLNVKKELLIKLILNLDQESDKIFRKKSIVKIQYILNILDNIL